MSELHQISTNFETGALVRAKWMRWCATASVALNHAAISLWLVETQWQAKTHQEESTMTAGLTYHWTDSKVETVTNQL